MIKAADDLLFNLAIVPNAEQVDIIEQVQLLELSLAQQLLTAAVNGNVACRLLWLS